MAMKEPNPYNIKFAAPKQKYPINPMEIRYLIMEEAKPMEVISQLYYRVYVTFTPGLDQKEKKRTWTGGPKARVPGQKMAEGEFNTGSANPSADPPLELRHILEIMQWLFTEIQIIMKPLIYEISRVEPIKNRPQYLTRLQCVNTQAVAAGYSNSKHRPYDMLAAIFLCADNMHGSPEEKKQLKKYQLTFMMMYLEQSSHCEYRPEDIYWHNHVFVSDHPEEKKPVQAAVPKKNHHRRKKNNFRH